MLSLAVVAVDPGHDDGFGLREGLAMVQPDTFLLQGAEEAFNDPVVLRGVSRDQLLGHRKLLGGPNEQAGQEDGPVIVPQPQALGYVGETSVALENALLQGIDRLYGPALAGEPSADALAAASIEDADKTRPAIPTTQTSS